MLPKVTKGRQNNPVPLSSKSKLHKAANLYEEFTGHDATYYDSLDIDWPAAGARIGHVDGIMYTTVRDGETEKYIHKFKKSARPEMMVSHDGKQVLPIGGNYTFTDRGIVDN